MIALTLRLFRPIQVHSEIFRIYRFVSLSVETGDITPPGEKHMPDKINQRLLDINTLDPASYDKILVQFSGGKDSLASTLLALIALPESARSKVELWHQDVDGKEGSTLFDWECTHAYCEAVAAHLGVPIYFQWRIGGLEGVCDRDTGDKSEAVRFEVPASEMADPMPRAKLPQGTPRFPSVPEMINTLQTGGAGQPKRIMAFPAQGSIKAGRRCSPQAKIDPSHLALNNQRRFVGKRILWVTGERAEEGSTETKQGPRASYAQFERHLCDSRKKTVHHWRPVHQWTEAQVWDLIAENLIIPHPAYFLGFSRLSCRPCIFIGANEMATLRRDYLATFEALAAKEIIYGKTINSKRERGQLVKVSVNDLADKGTAFKAWPAMQAIATSRTWDGPVVYPQGKTWVLPLGAFSKSCCGPKD